MLALLVKGGWVMAVLLLLSVLALAVVIERLMAHGLYGGDGLVAEVRSRGEACWDQGVEAMEEAMDLVANQGLDAMEARLPLLSAVAQAAPLLGLLGTVTGMIEAFRRIELAGGAVEAGILAGGIWEALLTTAFGLVVAIPALFAQHWFQARLDRVTRRMRREAEILLHRRRADAR